MFQLKRRSFIAGLLSSLASPAVVKAENIMKIYQPNLPLTELMEKFGGQWLVCNGAAISKTKFPELFETFGYKYSDRKSGEHFLLPDFRKQIMMGRLSIEGQKVEPIILSKYEAQSSFLVNDKEIKIVKNSNVVSYSGYEQVSKVSSNMPARAPIGHIRPYVTYERGRPIRSVG
jgi:hypothetical protein